MFADKIRGAITSQLFQFSAKFNQLFSIVVLSHFIILNSRFFNHVLAPPPLHPHTKKPHRFPGHSITGFSPHQLILTFPLRLGSAITRRRPIILFDGQCRAAAEISRTTIASPTREHELTRSNPKRKTPRVGDVT